MTDDTPPGEPLSISRSRSKVIGLVVAALVLCWGGVLLIGEGGLGALMGVLCVVFFGAGAVILARDAISPRPLVVLDAGGLSLPRQRIAVPWSEVADVGVRKVRSASFVTVEISDPRRLETERFHELRNLESHLEGHKAILALISGVAVVSGSLSVREAAKTLSADFASSPTRIDIATVALPYSPQELADEIRRWDEADMESL